MIIFRNLIAIVAGIIAGSVVNMGLVMLGPSLIPAPAGVDVTSAESIGAAIHLFEPRHFVMPFLAHALGTLAGASVGYLLCATHRTAISYGIGLLFLAGGVAASFMIPAPAWFIALDLVVAYIPMAWIANGLGSRLKGSFESGRDRT